MGQYPSDSFLFYTLPNDGQVFGNRLFLKFSSRFDNEFIREERKFFPEKLLIQNVFYQANEKTLIEIQMLDSTSRVNRFSGG